MPDALEVLKTSDLDWTSVSPAALIQPGERTGTFRLGKDTPLTDSKAESRISAEDFGARLWWTRWGIPATLASALQSLTDPTCDSFPALM
jgi:hypothetical protein